jgi:hypothetical protein
MVRLPAKNARTRSLPYKKWHTSDVLRAVYLAGRGASAREIADQIGGTTPERVRAMLRNHGFGLMRSRTYEDILFLRWKTDDRQKLDTASDKLDREPAELAALIIRKALEARIVEKLVDPFDVVGL